MKYYSDLLALGCFTRQDIVYLTGNYDTAGTLLKNYQKKGYIQSIKRNLYVAINIAENEPVATKYQIATHITPTAYVSHHTAFSYYGCANQVSCQVDVSSETPFVSFDFGGNIYTYIASRIRDGIVIRPDGVMITDMERTVLDGINDYEKIMGLEELLRCIALLPSINENKLLEYLTAYDKQILYQKVGYILRHFKQEYHLSDEFFSLCATHIGKSTRYLTANRRGVYDKTWRMVVPDNLQSFISKGSE